MLEQIDQCRSNQISLDEFEEKLWRLLDQVDERFPLTLTSKVEDLVLELKRQRSRNLSSAAGSAPDEDLGTDVIYNDVIGELSRFLT